MRPISNNRISKIEKLITPKQLKIALPNTTEKKIKHHRNQIEDILAKKNGRFIVVVGPCSIHDTNSALDYAERLKKLAIELEDQLFIIMRTYFEKPRTTIGWKGFINDPLLDNSCQINLGLEKARRILISISQLGLPVATEFLDTLTPQYISDLISWGAIGARTAESQIHRNLASGLSMPIGIKNATTGSVKIAIDAMIAANHPHTFLGIDDNGNASVLHTTGNPNTHIILRGGEITGPNFTHEHVSAANQQLIEQCLTSSIMIDCSHGNSEKNHAKQCDVLDYISKTLINSSTPVIGVMLESFIHAGKQNLAPKKPLEYGTSITDACIDWETTKKCLRNLAQTVRDKMEAVHGG